uniref:VWFD domain-containing protein n=1 Tax=Latimeria chalumnae TaxID=7897 RepID=H2ZW79_LATCH
CGVSGDPHYYTFDKQVHHFMGTCTYTLSMLCEPNSALPYFNVEAANEHRGGNTHASYVKRVIVHVYDHRITLGKHRAVKMNGVDMILPVKVSSEVHVGISGQYVMVTTSFGLKVRFDGNHRVEVTLPSNYRGKVCGMCGNYNKDPTDDFLNPDGGMEADSVSLGNSWQVSNDTSCSTDTGHISNCTEDEQQTIQSNTFCGMINDVNGPFKQCHAVLDPKDFFTSCAYDLCELNMDSGALCMSLQSYADACQALGVKIEPWRNATFCALHCGPNSHYEHCGTACPATCVNPNSPSTCSLTCVEGCSCDSGYVLYNDKCVPRSLCGCWHDGQHYPVGSEFWTDDTCSTKCTCPSQGGKMNCVTSTCPKDYYCGIKNGVPGCYPFTYGICRVHNDPHYNTFDKMTHSFMGTCTYTLAKLCRNTTSLPYFNIEAKNENRGNSKVSYVQKVFVDVYDHRISIAKNEPSRVLVDGVWVTLPVTLAGGLLKVSRSGRYVSLETDFRMTVSYDTHHSVEVKLPTTYFNMTCGMCGNFNNLRNDEFMMPDGQQAGTTNQLGNSWKVNDTDPNCKDPKPPEHCPEEEENRYKSDEYCGLINSKEGPFRSCHSVVNPDTFFDSCIFDLCVLNGVSQILCNTLEAYADACQSVGVIFPPWRNSTFCPIACPSNSHYNACSNACPATCTDQLAPGSCSKPCIEGCECNDGFVLSGGTCVSMDNCGCFYNGKYYEKGASFWEKNCESKCQCKGNNETKCTSSSCRLDQICKVQNGIPKCVLAATTTCHIYGDPHYITFDGRLYHFQGACNYTLTETCGNTSVPFSVTARNEHRGSQAWSALNSVALRLKNLQIVLKKNKKVDINGVQVSLPLDHSPGLKISIIGRYVVVETYFGLQLHFDGDHELFVHVNERYKKQLCGLCGTYSGNQLDDFQRPDGVLAENSNDFGNSWRVMDNDWVCDPIVPVPPQCDPIFGYEAEKHCKIIMAVGGPFEDCHWYIPPQLYFESCVYDQCATGGNSEIFCNALGSYAAACQQTGVSLGDWWKDTACAVNCSKVSHIFFCDFVCPLYCYKLHVDNYTRIKCSNEANCNKLLIQSCIKFTCITCFYSSVHFSKTKSNHIPNSEEHAVLNYTSKIQTKIQYTTIPLQKVGTIIAPSNFFSVITQGYLCTLYCTQRCYKSGSGFCCFPNTDSVCSASGDPHYNTFDHRVHHFMGTCTYTLSKLCNDSLGLPFFEVTTTNEHRGANTKVSYVNSVYVDVHNNKISLLKNKNVNLYKVNGRRVNLPVSIGNWIVIRNTGAYVQMETDFGLFVRFDGNHYVDVSLAPEYRGLLCGLCGNYNGDSNDDIIKPDGSFAKNSNELGDSWRVPDNDTNCWLRCSGTVAPPECEPKVETEASEMTACGMITNPTGNSFSYCHAKVNPQNFFDNCLYDMCASGGQSVSLCFAIQSYADRCTQAGICIEWRNTTFCPISCPGSSQYKSCGTRCPATCTDPSASTSCNLLPVEGCFCNEGYVLSGDKCVPKSKCGCMDANKNYYLLGESWYTHNNCSERCTCNSNNNITCTDWECGVLEKCKIEDGILGCQATGRASCHIAGDPHYFTFDKVMHTFMGACAYTLVQVCNSSNTIPLTIIGKNEERGPTLATYLKEVYIDVYNTQIVLQKNKRILVCIQYLFVQFGNDTKIIVLSSNRAEVRMGVGVVLVLAQIKAVVMKNPAAFKTTVCGMCGNYNGKQDDELLMLGGQMAHNVTQFGNSWKAENCQPSPDLSSCLPDTREELGPPCATGAKPVIEAQCQELLSNTFKPCHHLVRPDLFIQSCIYDMCKYDGMLSTLCNIIQAYADACKSEGANFKWRNSTFCPLPCPPNSHYTDCTPSCQSTCNDIYAVSTCEKSSFCMEGCVCDEGHVLSNDECVPLDECGCRDESDNYYKVGERWITPHCTKKCQCTKGRKIKCQAYNCEPGEICTLRNDGKHRCKPTGFAKCSITGDPHYLTFDGLMHHFQGEKTYTLVQTSDTISENLQQFTIVGKNAHLVEKHGFTYLKEIRINVYNHSIQFKQKKKLVLDGIKIDPPVQPQEGLRIYQRATRINLKTDFGLSVSFDGQENSDITVPNTYKKKIGGLCGNFDGKYKNDFTKPDGTRVKDVNEFGESWDVNKNKAAFRHRQGPKIFNPPCSTAQLQIMNSTNYCAAVVDPQGPFRSCHQTVEPDVYLATCLFDVCAQFNSTELLCSNLEQYALACQEKGVALTHWRKELGCEMKCPPNSQYTSCMSACPASCSNLAAPSECESSCLEGCECLPGFVLSGFDCVPYKECGCSYLNNYYKVNEHFMTDDCSQSCICTQSSTVSCQRTQCTPEESCTIFSFTRGC